MKRAVIMAGGQGRRLIPYTLTFPKPMMPVSDFPILEIVIRQLADAGFTHITLAVGHLSELLEAYFGDGFRWNVRIDYSHEIRPLGTTGPLGLIEDLPDDFLVMNGDILTTIDYSRIYDYHCNGEAELTIAAYRASTNVDFGVLEFDGRHELIGYREKPVIPYDVSMGIYLFRKSVLDLFDPGDSIDFPTLVNAMLAAGRTIKVYPAECRWLDIGRPDDYEVATANFEKYRDEFLPTQTSDEGAGVATFDEQQLEDGPMGSSTGNMQRGRQEQPR